MNEALTEYITFTTIATIALFFQFWWRLSHPFHCSCGYQTFFAHRMFKHLQIGHKYVEHRSE